MSAGATLRLHSYRSAENTLNPGRESPYIAGQKGQKGVGRVLKDAWCVGVLNILLYSKYILFPLVRCSISSNLRYPDMSSLETYKYMLELNPGAHLRTKFQRTFLKGLKQLTAWYWRRRRGGCRSNSSTNWSTIACGETRKQTRTKVSYWP